MAADTNRLMELQEQAARFARDAKLLEADQGERRDALAQVAEHTEGFLSQLDTQPGYRQTPDMGAELEGFDIESVGRSLELALKLFADNVDYPGSHPTSPTHFAYIPVSATYYSALGDFLAAVTNRFSGNFFAGPGAVRLEKVLIKWMKQLVGFPQAASGNLLSGGSLATQSALVTAREVLGLKPRDFEDSVIYLTEHTHHCVTKALHIIGLGNCQQHQVAIDEYGRMMPEDLSRRIQEDRRKGLKPWVILGSAGTTNLGSVDPLTALADIARQQQLWFHVDAAYGGFFQLTEVGRQALAGIDRADSLVLDPHKSLYVPFGTGAVLIRDGQALYRSHMHSADYLQDTMTDEHMHDPSNLGPELTRHFRAVRLWLPLMVLGTRPYEAALNEKICLARYAYERLSEIPEVELGPYPDLSIFVFRFLPSKGDADDFNTRLLTELTQDGRIFLSSTQVGGRYFIRFPVLSFRTHLDHIDLAIDTISQKAAALSC